MRTTERRTTRVVWTAGIGQQRLAAMRRRQQQQVEFDLRRLSVFR